MKFPYDVVFTANKELNAEENWQTLLKFYPNAKRIDNMPSIYEAYNAAADVSEEELLLIVDADNIILTNDLELENSEYNEWRAEQTLAGKIVMLWRATNRVNTIMNGHGSLKLFARKSLRRGFVGEDVTMGMGLSVSSVMKVGSIHAFDYDSFNTWRTAFREAAKLVYNPFFMSPTWVHVWADEGFGPFGKEARAGAQAGIKFAKNNSKGALTMIFNREWIRFEYEKWLRNEK